MATGLLAASAATASPAPPSYDERPPSAAVLERVNSHSLAGTSYTGIDVADDDSHLEREAPIKRPLNRPKGTWVQMNDPVTSMTTDYTDWPKDQKEAMARDIQTAWRTDKLHEMSYTQFLLNVREGHVESAQYSRNKKTLIVKTKESAPRGARTERVGLIYDPALYDFLCANGVFLKDAPSGPVAGVQMGLIRAFTPFMAAVLIIKVSFSLGQQQKPDRLFGGARMDMINSKDIPISFDDIAGIDEVKAEILEIVTFLREQERFLALGARSPAGVLLVGPPGTGKTLLAKAIAGEAGVPFFSSSGTDFSEMYVGVGASRVRDMFERARKNSPCIIFIDEFDGIGQARSATGGGDDESVHTINQLLTEMDGFDDNTGVVVLAATNRPGSLDEALTRPGRFDRIISLPLPNLEGRVGVLKVHARNKRVDEAVDYQRVSRATAGLTGAELMNLMNTAAIETVRQRRQVITEDDIFSALEQIHTEKYGGGQGDVQHEQGGVNPLIRRSISVYMAAKAIIGCLSPEYDDLQKIVVTPQDMPTGYTYFIPQDAHLESRITTRSFLEGHVVVAMAGRVAEQAVMGAANLTSIGAHDLRVANNLAREMIFRCGWSKKLGPISIMTETKDILNGTTDQQLAEMSPKLAAAAFEEIEDMLAGAEAKAYFGLLLNWELFNAMVDELMTKDNHVLNRLEVAELLEKHNAVAFVDSFTEGFYFTEDRKLVWPAHYDHLVSDAARMANGNLAHAPDEAQALHQHNPLVHPLNPYQPTGSYPPMMAEQIMGENFYMKPEAFATTPAGQEGPSGSTNGSSPARSAQPAGARFAAAAKPDSPARAAWTTLEDDK